jgi:hypothetical protein
MIIVSNHINMSHTDPFKIDMIENDLEANKMSKNIVPLFGSIFDIEKKGAKYSLVNKNWNNRIHGKVINYDRTSPNSIFFEIQTKYVPPISFFDYLVESKRYSIEATYGTEKTNYEDFNEFGFVGAYDNGDDECWETTPHNLKDDLIPPHLLVLYNIV